jgi:hypothetical protein
MSNIVFDQNQIKVICYDNSKVNIQYSNITSVSIFSNSEERKKYLTGAFSGIGVTVLLYYMFTTTSNELGKNLDEKTLFLFLVMLIICSYPLYKWNKTPTQLLFIQTKDFRNFKVEVKENEIEDCILKIEGIINNL